VHLQTALTGFIALIIAMGIGRFALTPQLPLMIQDNQIDVTGAGLVAAVNYLGYLVGSFDAMRAQSHAALRLHLGLWLSVVCALASAWAGDLASHGILRFVAGVASAWVMIMIAGWTQDQLAHSGRPTLAAAVFTGPGAGIVLVGSVAILINQIFASAGAGWVAYGVVALLALVSLQRTLPRQLPDRGSGPSVGLPRSAALTRLALSYGLAGFGYILPATFLAHLAWKQYPGSLLADLFWPVFGLAAMAGVLIGAHTSLRGNTPTRLAWALWLQALGVLACWLVPGVPGLALGAILAGGTFLAIVQLAMQTGRELVPEHSRAVAGLITTAYAVGQLVGPLLAAISTHYFDSLDPALAMAAFALVAAGVLVHPQLQREPEDALCEHQNHP